MAMFGRNREPARTPYLPSLLSPLARAKIQAGVLPEFDVSDLELAGAEKCHYVERAIYERKIRVPRGDSEGRSGRQRAFHGRRKAGGRSRSAGVVDISFEQHPGTLYVTSWRIVFEPSEKGDKCGWQREVAQLLVVKPYLNCVKLQFGPESLKVFVPDGGLAERAICLVWSPVR